MTTNCLYKNKSGHANTSGGREGRAQCNIGRQQQQKKTEQKTEQKTKPKRNPQKNKMEEKQTKIQNKH